MAGQDPRLPRGRFHAHGSQAVLLDLHNYFDYRERQSATAAVRATQVASHHRYDIKGVMTAGQLPGLPRG